MHSIIYFIKKFIWKIIKLRGVGYKSYGNHTLFYKPDRIVGKRYITIGNKVSILKHARIEAIDRFNDQTICPALIIEDEVTIEQNAHIIATGKLLIGKGTTISGNVYISDCSHQYNNIYLDVQKQPLDCKITSIGQNSFIGYGAVILPGAQLGEHCIVGANAVVMPGEYQDYSVIVGIPAKVKKIYNQETKEWDNVGK